MANAVEIITQLKDSGNAKFGNQQFNEALHDYCIALQLSESTYKQQNNVFIIDLMSVIYSNRAQCCIQLKEYEKGIIDCNESILLTTKTNNSNYTKLWKTYYRRAICYEALQELKNALSDLQNANNLWFKYNTKQSTKSCNKKHKNQHKPARNSTIDAAITRIKAKLNEKMTEHPSKSNTFLNSNVFEKKHANALINNGYVIIDNFFTLDIANALLFELKSMINLQNPSYLKPNVTYFQNQENEIVPFSKPNIWELDLHSIFDENCASQTSNKTIHELKHKQRFNKMHHIFSSNVLSDVLEAKLNENDDKWHLNKGEGKYGIKLQWNEGKNGCFPWHIDNPGSNKRRITMIFYWNKEWKKQDGGEIVIMPFMDKQIVIPPLFNRCVIFLSELMLHRVLPANKTRYCFSVWFDKAADAMDIDDILLCGDEEEEEEKEKLGAVLIHKDMLWLNKGSVQCTLSRWIYDKEYVQSLKDCVVDTKSVVFKQLYAMHVKHIKNLKEANKDTGLIEIVEWLQKNKPNETIFWDEM